MDVLTYDILRSTQMQEDERRTRKRVVTLNYINASVLSYTMTAT